MNTVMAVPQVEPLNQDKPKLLFDLCDIENAGVIEKLPLEVLHQNIHTGRVILDEDNPLVTKMILLGYRPMRLKWLPDSK
jgi:hypothetical protein